MWVASYRSFCAVFFSHGFNGILRKAPSAVGYSLVNSSNCTRSRVHRHSRSGRQHHWTKQYTKYLEVGPPLFPCSLYTLCLSVIGCSSRAMMHGGKLIIALDNKIFHHWTGVDSVSCCAGRNAESRLVFRSTSFLPVPVSLFRENSAYIITRCHHV